ncbi:MAG TPA: sigma 54-interacting transcriptional regulator, partial [Nitrospiria bacterium]|nr:sigma 54-interacting transcriptional regulator [Nitrospiria bacterium]
LRPGRRIVFTEVFMRHSKARHIESPDFLDLFDESIVTIGLDKRIRYLNRAAREMLGYTLEEARRQPCSAIVQCAECDANCHLDNALQTGKTVDRFETSLLTRLGKSLKVRLSATLLENDKGEIVGGVEVIRNRTFPPARNGEPDSFDGMLGEGETMKGVFSTLRSAGENDVPLFLMGETGTGRESAARAVHQYSSRRGGPFVKVNCAGLPQQVLLRELFGYPKGAFPGAFSDKRGILQGASGGTVYLDEVGSLGPELQARLLKVMQSGRAARNGEKKTFRVDVRFMASSNKDLSVLAKKGKFLPDLFNALSTFKVGLPPLSERREDIPALVKYFIDGLNLRLGKQVKSVSSKVMDVLMNYAYPENILELEKIIEHSMLFCRGRVLQPAHLPRNIFQVRDEHMDTLLSGPDPLKALERRFFLKVLSECRWNQKTAAARLKVSRTTLWRRLKELGIETPVK